MGPTLSFDASIRYHTRNSVRIAAVVSHGAARVASPTARMVLRTTLVTLETMASNMVLLLVMADETGRETTDANACARTRPVLVTGGENRFPDVSRAFSRPGSFDRSRPILGNGDQKPGSHVHRSFSRRDSFSALTAERRVMRADRLSARCHPPCQTLLRS